MFAAKKTKFRLIWTAPNGKLAGAFFKTWDDLEAFSAKCVKQGLCPFVPDGYSTPYDAA